MFLGFTVCLRAQMKLWDGNFIFWSGNVGFGVAGHKKNAGYIYLNEIWLVFSWPGPHVIKLFTTIYLLMSIIS